MRGRGGYCLGLGVLLLLSTFRPVAAQTPTRQPPLAWLRVHSVQRLEQRLMETAQLGQMPGVAQLVLGFLQVRWGRLHGLDRQRPIGVVWPTLLTDVESPVIWVIPYSDKAMLWRTLQRLFPESTMKTNALTLGGSVGQQFGQFDEKAKLLFVTREKALLQELDIAVFGTGFDQLEPDTQAAEEGQVAAPQADIVVRVDVAGAKMRYPAAWHRLTDQMMQGVHQQRAAALAAARTEADVAFATVASQLWQKRQKQALNDVLQIESRLTLDPQGWFADLEAWMQPHSVMDKVLRLQTESVPFTPHSFSDDALLRVLVSMRQPTSWQQEHRRFAAHWQRAVESHLGDRSNETPEQRAAHLAGLRSMFSGLMQVLTDPVLYVAAEAKRRPSSTSVAPFNLEITGGLRLKQSDVQLEALLTQVLPILSTEDQPLQVKRKVALHHEVALHQIIMPSVDLLPTQASAAPSLIVDNLFVSAHEPMLFWHTGSSFAALTQWLDRERSRSPTSDPQRMTLLRLDAPMALLMGWLWGAYEERGASHMGRRVVHRLRQVDVPIRIDVTPQVRAMSPRWQPSLGKLNQMHLRPVMPSEPSTDGPLRVRSVRLRMTIPQALLRQGATLLSQEFFQVLGQSLFRR